MIIYIQISQKIHVKLILKLPDFWNVGIIVIKEMTDSRYSHYCCFENT